MRYEQTLRGFTIVELVTVVLLLGALTAVAMSRMVQPSAFAPSIVAQALVAQTRLAQQTAASRHDAVTTLTIDRLGSDWRFQLETDVDGVLRTELVERSDTALQASSGTVTASIDATTPLRMEFDTIGNLTDVAIGAGVGDANLGISLTVNGSTNRQVCVYATGYAVAEACA